MNRVQVIAGAIAAATLALAANTAAAAALTPTFDNAPAGWTTDRYNPHSFADVGTYQGRDPVLGIGIHRDEGAGARGAGFGDQFYNTQGMQHTISGGAGDSIAAALYIPQLWSDGANGNVRSDMWGVMTDGAVAPTLQYPIIGFTNYGGLARLRVWDQDTANGWVDLGTAIDYDDWNTFSISFTGSAYVFAVNGVDVYTDNTIAATTAFSAVIMQAYNFWDPTIQGANAINYTAHWSNVDGAEVPEPSGIALLALGLVAAARARRRTR